MLNTSSKTMRFIIIACMALAVIVVAVLLIPRWCMTPKNEAAATKAPLKSASEEYSAGAKAAVLQIADAANQYHAQTSIWPTKVEQLEQKGLLVIPDSTKRWWMFVISGGPVTSISALSKDSMPDGGGRPLIYRPESGKWFGYGATPKK